MRRRALLAATLSAVAAVAVTALWWLRAPDDSGPTDPAQVDPVTGPTTFRVASFNILSAWHTSARGPNPRRASGEARMGHTLRLLDRHAISVAGMQEVHGRQYAELERLRGADWDRYPGLSLRPQDSHNSIIWRTEDWVAIRTQDRHRAVLPRPRGADALPEGCVPPEATRIDWILGSEELRFSGYRVVRSGAGEAGLGPPLIISDVTVPVGEAATRCCRCVRVHSHGHGPPAYRPVIWDGSVRLERTVTWVACARPRA